MEYLIALLIANAAVLIIDAAVIPEKISVWLFYRRYHKYVPYEYIEIPLIGCSLCTTLWATMIYFLLTLGVTPLSFLLPFTYSLYATIIRRILNG